MHVLEHVHTFGFQAHALQQILAIKKYEQKTVDWTWSTPKCRRIYTQQIAFKCFIMFYHVPIEIALAGDVSNLQTNQKIN